MADAAEYSGTNYVTVGDGQVAYRVIGDGPRDIVWCMGAGSHSELRGTIPWTDALFRQLGRSQRLIFFDRRGVGASDPVPLSAPLTWEEYAEDLGAVLGAVDSHQAAVFGFLEAGAIAILFAAMHPERVSHLILLNASARYLEAEDYSAGTSPSVIDEIVAWIGANWGSEHMVQMLFPTMATDAESTAATARSMRASMTPRAAALQMGYYMRDLDIRRFLPSVQAPTLVVQARDSTLFSPAMGRYLAENIPRATLLETPGSDVLPEPIVDFAADLVEFLTGERPPVEIDRVLTTVLFTDIVGSTERAVSLGDSRWRSLLDTHDRIVREQLRRFRGNEIKTMGDGFLASFDGPARAIRCAQAISQAMAAMDLPVRAGLHTGECELRGDDLGGISVHVAARIGALAGSAEVLISGTVRDLVSGSGIEFFDRGEHELKGVPGSWKLFAVRG
jgi:class 3 adenylate cyclase